MTSPVAAESRIEPELPTERRSGGLGRRLLAVLIAIGLLVAGLVVGTVLGVVALLALLAATVDLTPETIADPATLADPAVFYALLVATSLGWIVVGGLYLLVSKVSAPVRIPDARDLTVAAVATVAVVVGAVAVELLARAAGVRGVETVFPEFSLADPLVLVGTLAVVALVVPLAEELFFRGAIQGGLRRRFGTLGAVALASLLFAAIHAANFVGGLTGGALVALGFIFVVSLVLGYAYERTGNLLVPILVHGAYNAILVAITALALF